MRKRWSLSLVAVLAGFLTGSGALAGDFHAFNIQPGAGSGDTRTMNEDLRHEYLSRGQEYLRTYLRESMLRLAADQGLAMDPETLEPAATLDFTSYYQQYLPQLDAKLRVLAKEDLQQYLYCGRFLPLKFEFDSVYRLLPRLQMSARVKAPLDDLLLVEFGSSIQWSDQVQTRLQYNLKNGEQSYAGMNMGLSWDVQNWHVSVDYDVTPNLIQQQRISIGRNF